MKVYRLVHKDYKEYIHYQGRDKFIIAIKTQIKELNWGD